MKNRIVRLLTPAVFLALLFGFALANLLTPDRAFSESENRLLQQRPAFSFDALLDGSFAAEVEGWISDQFWGRDRFIGWKTGVDYLVGKRDANGVYFAADGYLIEKHDAASLNREQQAKNIARLQSFVNRAAESLGEAHVRVMIVPTAAETLKEKLPAFAAEFSQPELFAAVQSGIPAECWVELLEPMAAHREEYLYYKTDHHWTTLGAYYGYRAWCESVSVPGLTDADFHRRQVSDSFYGTLYSKARLATTKPDQMQVYLPRQEQSYQVDYNMGEKQTQTLYAEEYLSKRDKYSYYLGGNNALVTIKSDLQNGKKLLLVKDSYAHSMVPFLVNEFEEIAMIDLRYFNQPLSEFMEQNAFTDLLVLYNAVTFSEDLGVMKMDR